MVGTSAGSIVGAQLTSDVGLEELYAAARAADPGPLAASTAGSRCGFGSRCCRPQATCQRSGAGSAALSLKAAAAGRLPTLQSRYDAMIERLPSLDWPDRDLRITASTPAPASSGC